MTVYTILELSPVAQTVGTLPSGWLDEIVTPSPMGDVADNSDATYTTLGTERPATVGDRSSVLSCNFQYSGSFSSAFIHMRVRAKNTADYLANPSWNSDLADIETFCLDSGNTVLDNWTQVVHPAGTTPDVQLQRLADGGVSAPEWFRFLYLGTFAPVDPETPSEDTWRPLGYDSGSVGGQMLDALQGGGLQVAFFVRDVAFDTGWRDYIDLHEVRLVLAFPESDFIYGGLGSNPVTRLLPRDDTLGVGGPNRLVPPPRANRIVGKQP